MTTTRRSLWVLAIAGVAAGAAFAALRLPAVGASLARQALPLAAVAAVQPASAVSVVGATALAATAPAIATPASGRDDDFADRHPIACCAY